MAVNVKLGVDMSSFKKGITEANAQLKTFDAQLKFADASMKNAGNAEQGLLTKTDALTGKLKVQKQMLQQYSKALEDMRNAGVDPLSKEYQNMEAALLNANAAMLDTDTALKQLTGAQKDAATSADQLTQSVNNIGKKISLDQVINGIDKITGGLEKAAKKAVELGQELFNNVMNRAQWADDVGTMAMMYGIDIDTFQRMQKLVTNGLDTSVETMLSSQDKLKRGIGKNSKEVMGYLEELGLTKSGGPDWLGTNTSPITSDPLDMMFRAGQALMNMSDAYDKEAAATALFGKSWKEMIPLFSQYKTVEEYNAALAEVNVVSEENVTALAELNDKVGELKGNLETLSTDILATMAQALTAGAEALNGLLENLMEYLRTPEGQAMLERLGEAVSGLFDDLSKIDPAQVVEGFVGVFEKIISGLEWIVDNKDTVIAALEAIVIGWAGLKLTGGALSILQLINGLKGLGIGTGASAASGAATGASAAAGGGAAVAGGNAMTATLGGGASFAGAGLAMAGAMFIDGIIQDQNLVREMTEKGMQQILEYNGKSESFSGSEYFDLWDLFTKYGTVAGGAEDRAKIKEFADHYISVFNEETADPLLETVLDSMTDEQYDNFHEMMERIHNGDHFYGNDSEDLSQAVTDMISTIEGLMAENPVKTEINPVVPENAAQTISSEIGTVPVIISPYSRLKMPGHANGLPFVPYDGYLSVLHRGERVMTASENKHYTYNNNTYFGNVNLNNGLEVDALTESIARNNRRKASGYGT